MNISPKKNILILFLITFLTSAFFWFSFYFNLPGKIGFPDVSLETVFQNYDGPNYLAISKCGYRKDCLAQNFSLPQPLEYYPAHLPAFPAIIKFFDLFTTGPKAMLLATLFGSLFLSLASFYFFSLFLNQKKSFCLSLLLIFFPARLLVLRLVGAPETWFIGATLFSLYFFQRQKYFPSVLMAVFAQTLKSPGVLLFGSYVLFALYQFYTHQIDIQTLAKKYGPFLLIPLSLLPIFLLYKLQSGDFFAYFHSGDNFHLSLLPYTVFISTKSWIGSLWLEDIVYLYLFALAALFQLFKKYKISPLTIYSAVFTLATLLVAHRDISRYIAPLYPFMFLAFSSFLSRKSTKIVFLFLSPALVLFTFNFIAHNIAPIADWTPYL